MNRIMRIIAAGLLAAALAAVSALPAFAGAWTNISPNGWQTTSTFYIGDDGQYVKSRWVMYNGTWYWITADGTRATSVGIADDGYIYDANGVWVPSANSGNSYRKNGTGPVPNGGTVTPNSGGYNNGYGPNYSGAGYRPSNYGPGAGGISDPHR